ncbi:MAG: MASE1 domain-containing protein [Elusimicrobia bacterium]|nr:MASE1 domain-containing protein [Elusimicrobiota bacterium]
MKTAGPSPAARRLALFAGSTAGYYLLARAGLTLAVPGTVSCAVWPAAGFAAAAVLLLGPLAAAGVALGSCLANLQVQLAAAAPAAPAFLASTATGLASAAQAWITALLIERAPGGTDFLESVRGVLAFAALTPLACLLAASVGASAFVAAGLVPRALYGSAWLTWWLGDAAGVLLVCPLLLAWRPGAARRAGAAGGFETGAALALIGACAWFGFGGALDGVGHPFSFAPLLALIWLACRLDARATTGGAVLLAILIQWRTLRGEGAFASGSAAAADLLFASAYAAAAALTAFLLRALLAERRRVEEELRGARAALERRVGERDQDLWEANATLRVAALARRGDQQRIQLYRRLVEALPIGAAILRLNDPDDPASWRVTELNPAGRALAGVAAGGGLGTLRDFAPEVLETELPRVCREVLNDGHERELADFSDPVRAPGVRFALKVFALEPPLVGVIFEDVTVARAAQDAQRRSEEQLRLLIEGSRDYAIFRLDARGRVASWNRGAERVFGYAPSEILGRSYAVFFSDADVRAGEPGAHRREAEKNGRSEGEGWRRRKGGERFWGLSMLTPLRDEAGRLSGYVKLVHDATERRRAQRVLDDMTSELARSNAELQQFAYVASHDLQAPLRKAAAFADLLKSQLGGLPAEAGETMGRLLASLRGMQDLIDALLRLARVGAGALAAAPVELEPLAREVAEQFADEIARSGGEVRVEPLPVVEADAAQMRQLLQNLIENALKFRAPGRPPKIRIFSRPRADACAELCVQDDGVGFDPRYAARLFQPFQRLHSRREYPGTGMGLAICRKIAARHGGSISAQSAPGRGALFTVVLPATRSAGAGCGGGESWNRE